MTREPTPSTAGKNLTGSGCVILGVKLELVNSQGDPLGGEGTSMTPPAARAVTGGFPSTAGAGIVPGVKYPSTDETVTVRWWYNIGTLAQPGSRGEGGGAPAEHAARSDDAEVMAG